MSRNVAILVALSWLVANSVQAGILYVDATSGAGGNTVLAAGGEFSPPLNGTTGNDNNWEQRTVFGSSGNIFESAGEGAGASENAPELKTTISGLVPGWQYEVFAYFWDPTSTVEDWNLRAGASSSPGANTVYSAADATVELGSSAAVLASTQTFDVAPTIMSESGRALLGASLGYFTATGGQVSVFIDDLGAAGTVNKRSWFDGVGYAAVPEPATLGLGTIAACAALAVALRRRAT